MPKKLEVMSKDWRELIDTDFPEIKITDEVREATIAYATSHLTNDTRVATGRFYTDKEYQQYREKILLTPLP
jgi:hypothetical protein